MLTSQELRPGNWLIDSVDRNYCIVSSIGSSINLEKFGRSYSQELYWLQPIRISSNILTLAHFESLDGGHYKKANTGVDIYCFPIANQRYRIALEAGQFKDVMYLHELQNVFRFIERYT